MNPPNEVGRSRYANKAAVEPHRIVMLTLSGLEMFFLDVPLLDVTD